jgi:serine/threonine protein kinase/tetratricopeptide (TPR) repeat protein
MATPLASGVVVCSVCGQPLNAKGDCPVCLLRTGLEETLVESKPPALVFGDFEVEQGPDGAYCELGHGAMGVTYLAVDKVLRRKVALKVIDVPAAARGSQPVRERFLREARAAAALRHPNVAAVFQFGTSPHSTHCYYAMELVEGETLAARVRRDGPLKVELALEIAIQTTRALMAAAAQNLIHRDLKPGNLMLVDSDEPQMVGRDRWARQEWTAQRAVPTVKVIDFGLAKAIADAGGEMDLTHGEFVGTPSFASPEQFGSGPVDARSDIYSLGATLWFALTGLPPHSGKTIEEIRERQTRDDLPIAQLVARKVPEPVVKLLRSTLTIDPSKRPASARELMEALESCRRKIAGRVGVFYKVAASIAVVATVATTLFILQVNRHKITSASATNIAPSAATLTALPEKSIAVLPLENLSPEKENEFFAAGVHDELLSDLAKIKELKVISRTSVMQYKSGTTRNLKEIAQQLSANNVVEGSVRRSGDRVRVSVQLIDARTDTHLWAEHYDRDVADVFAVQTEIAQQIADQLKANLSPGEKAAIAERPTADLVAYTYYAKAKEIDIYGNWQSAENEKAANQKVELLEKATQRDPNFVLAYCQLAKAQMDVENFELAKKAAETALRLGPDLPEPHLALARYYWLAPDSIIGVDREAAYNRVRDELAIVRRMLPNNAEALLIDATVGRHQNRWDAALANLQKASELDPRNGEVAYRLEEIYFEMRRYSELEQFIRKQAASGGPRVGAIEDPFNWLPRMKLAQGDTVAAQSLLEQLPVEYSPGEWIWDARFKTALYLRDYDAANRLIAATPGSAGWAEGQVARARGDKQKAMAAFAAAREKMEAQQADKPKDAEYFADLAKLDAGLGRKEEAIREARRAVELMPITKESLNGPDWVANLALVYAWTGERDRALEQLKKIATIPGSQGLPTYGDLLLNPRWDDLRGDKRFDKIVAAAKAASK